MNEEALKDSYDLFVAEGYEGSIEEFSSLLSSNPEALKDSYSLFQREGYEQPIEDYEMLVGVKKKANPYWFHNWAMVLRRYLHSLQMKLSI